MAANEEIIEEILTCSSSANEEEIVHIIQSSEDQDAPQETGLTQEERESQEHKELVFWVPALLMVGREQQRITVTQEELKRRVAPPECLRHGQPELFLESRLRLSKSAEYCH
nr:uncharacterized protein LOC113805940 [Penaeus vannamei]